MLKEFNQKEVFSGGYCPECGEYNRDTDGCSVASEDGSFFWCSYCGKPSVLIHNGAMFNLKGTIYEIVELTDQNASLIATIPVKRKNASPLWKPNKTHYQYFNRQHIINAMSEGYREDI